MSRAKLAAQSRDVSRGSREARRQRRQGVVPGVLYGHGKEARPFSTSEHDATMLIRRGATLIDLDIDGEKTITVIKDRQVHPVKNRLVHIDLLEVDMSEMLRSTVPLVLVGEAVGLKTGGVVDQTMREVEIDSTPGDIPEQIELDVSAMDAGDSVTLESAIIPKGVKLITDTSTTVATMTVPRGAKQIAEEQAAEDAEQAGESVEDAVAEASADAEAAEGGDSGS